MKKLSICLLIIIFMTSMLIMGVGCKKEATSEVETAEVETAEVETAEVEEVIEDAAAEEPYVETWEIPNLLFVTGDWGVYGEEMSWGLEKAIEEVNSAGGISGIPINVTIYDTGTHQPELAVTQMAKVLDTNPLVITGPHGSTDAEACSQLAVDEGVFMIQTTSSQTAYLKFRPWTYIQIPREEVWTWPTVQYWAQQEPDIKKVVFFVQPEATTWYEQAKQQMKALEAVGVEVIEEIAVTDVVDFSPIAVRAIANEPDGFVMYCYAEAMVKIANELQKRGVDENRRFLYFHGAGVPEFWELAEGDLDGAYHWTIFNVESQEERWLNLYEQYKEEKGPSPSWTVVSCYDEVYLIKKCFEELNITGNPDTLTEERNKIREWFDYVEDFEFATGTFDIIDGEKQEGAYMYTIKDNQAKDAVTMPFTWIE